LQLAPGDSTIKDSTGEDPVDRKMTIPKGKTRYQSMSFLHEVSFFFINSFLSFPSHRKRIILCFVYSDDNKPSFIHPSLEEEDMLSSCFVDADPVSSPQPIHKSEICIASPLKIDHPCSLEEVENNSQSSQILLPSIILAEPFHQLVNPHDQPTVFQIKIRNKLFKPLRLAYSLTLILLIPLSIFLGFLGRIMLQLRGTWGPLRTLLISFRSFMIMLP
jgi:hypothetical protein